MTNTNPLLNILNSLPNGFHDSWLDKMQIDWNLKTITLDMNIWIGNIGGRGGKSDESRKYGTLVLSELESVIFDRQPFADFNETHGTWIDIGTEFENSEYPSEFKVTPDSGWIYFFKKSSAMYFTARGADFRWKGNQT